MGSVILVSAVIGVLVGGVFAYVGYRLGYRHGFQDRSDMRVSRHTVDRLKQWEVDDGGS